MIAYKKEKVIETFSFLYMILDNYRTIVEDFLKVVAVIDYII